LSAVAHITEYKEGKFYSGEFRGSMSWNGYENNVLLRNEGVNEGGLPRFVDVAMALGADDIGDSRGVAVLDYDNDGDLDLAVNHNPGDVLPEGAPAVLLRNDLGQDHPWLQVELVGTSGNRDAAGAEVVVEAGGLSQLRLKSIGSSYASQRSARLHFGLGEAERVERLTVRWPGGGEEVFEDLPVRRRLRITEGRGLEELAFAAGVEEDETASGP
jgi:hypothetical protein